MAGVANVAVKLDATGVVQQLKAIQQGSIGAAKGFKELSDRAKAVQSAVQAQQGGFAKASTIQGVFTAKVRNTEKAIRAQINALRQVQSQVKLGGALYQKAQQQIDAYTKVLRDAKGATDNAGGSANKAGFSLEALGLKFAAITAAIKLFTESLNVAFARGAAEQKLKNFTDSAEEYQTALAVAARSADKFGMSQTEATKALGDTYSRLKGLGFGLKETSEIYDGFNAIAKASGTTAEDASGAFLQLSQALGSGTLQGDELRSILERMPNLAQEIAKSMGKSASEIREMGKSGQLTSEVIYKALKGAADASDDFSDKLTSQQKAFNKLGQVSDKLLNSIGKVFAPVVIKGAELLAAAGQKLSHWYDYVGGTVFPRLLKAIEPVITALKGAFEDIDFDIIRVIVQSILIKGFDTAVGIVTTFSNVLGFVVTKFKQLSENPVFQFITSQAIALAGALGLTNDKVEEFTQKQKGAQDESLKNLNNYSSMPQKIDAATEAQNRQVAALKQAVQQTEQQKQSVQAQAAALENALNVNQARLNAEREINSLQGKILERAYAQATTAQQRLQIAKQIFNNSVRGAQIEYQQAVASIQAEQQRLQLKLQGAEAEYNTIAARGQLAILESKSVEEEKKKTAQLQAALASQQAAAQVIANQITAQQQIGQYQQQAAEAQLRSKVLAAETALEQKLVSDKIGLSQTEASRLSTELSKGALSTKGLATSTNQVAVNANRSAYAFIGVAESAAQAATQINNAANAQMRLNAARAGGGGGGGGAPARAAEGAFWSGGFKAFAKGGMVKGPTLGLIGEGGEDEYIIPQSKAAGFAMNYLSGKRGAGAIPGFAEGGYVAPSSANVSIQTGPVTQMNGTNYVTTQQMGKAVQAGVQQTLDLIRRDGNVRSSIGLI